MAKTKPELSPRLVSRSSLLMFNLILWNLRGVGVVVIKSTVLCNLVCGKIPTLMSIVETKHSSLCLHKVRSQWNNDNFRCEDVTTSNGSGGLIFVWDKGAFKCLKRSKGERWIWLDGTVIEKKFHVGVILVYAPNDRSDRNSLWGELKAIKESATSPLLVIGDFNEVILPEERKGHSIAITSMEDFRNWADDMELIDLPLVGRKYMWHRGNQASQIDHAFIDALGWISSKI